jgi:PEP-CTERM motif
LESVPTVQQERNVMKFKTLIAAGILLVSGIAGAADTTVNAGGYSITYDPNQAVYGSTVSLSAREGNSYRFEWTLPIENLYSMPMPMFNLRPNPGYVFDGYLGVSLKNVLYIDMLDSLTLLFGAAWFGTKVDDSGAVSPINDSTVIFAQKLPQNPYTGTYSFDRNLLSLEDVSSLTVGYRFESRAGDKYSAVAPLQDAKVVFTLHAVPVPEPQAYLLMLAGVALLVGFARRRQAR